MVSTGDFLLLLLATTVQGGFMDYEDLVNSQKLPKTSGQAEGHSAVSALESPNAFSEERKTPAGEVATVGTTLSSTVNTETITDSISDDKAFKTAHNVGSEISQLPEDKDLEQLGKKKATAEAWKELFTGGEEETKQKPSPGKEAEGTAEGRAFRGPTPLKEVRLPVGNNFRVPTGDVDDVPAEAPRARGLYDIPSGWNLHKKIDTAMHSNVRNNPSQSDVVRIRNSEPTPVSSIRRYVSPVGKPQLISTSVVNSGTFVGTSALRNANSNAGSSARLYYPLDNGGYMLIHPRYASALRRGTPELEVHYGGQ